MTIDQKKLARALEILAGHVTFTDAGQREEVQAAVDQLAPADHPANDPKGRK